MVRKISKSFVNAGGVCVIKWTDPIPKGLGLGAKVQVATLISCKNSPSVVTQPYKSPLRTRQKYHRPKYQMN